MEKPDETTQLAAMMAVAMDQIGVMAEAVAGYRKKLVDGGVGAEAADQMAIAIHDMMIESIRSSVVKSRGWKR